LHGGLRDRSAIDPRHGSTGSIDFSSDDQRTIFFDRAEFLEKVTKRAIVWDIKYPLDPRLICSGSNTVRANSVTEKRTDGIDDDRLSGAGLARQNHQSRPKIKVNPIDNGKIFDREVNQH